MSHCRSIFVCLILISSTLVASGAVAGDGKGHVLLALDVFDLNLDIDSTFDIQGETRFFSSRPNHYLGGRLVGHSGNRQDKTLSLGKFFGVVWGKSSYFLNWEEPGLQSFPPLESSISTLAVPIGFDVNLRLGDILTISPYASGKFMWMIMNVEISNEDFKGNAVKLGFDAGTKVSLKLGKRRLAAGIGWTYIVNDEIEFEVDDLTFDSKTSGTSPEVFVGVEF